ncbi:hypothetical protein NPIL_357251, partial [Nephila pilipes]
MDPARMNSSSIKVVINSYSKHREHSITLEIIENETLLEAVTY